MMRREIAQKVALALAWSALSQYSARAAYSPAIVRIDTGSSNGPFTDAGGNVWASDSNINGGGSVSAGASTAIGNTEDNQATVYQTNRIGSSFTYSFGPQDGLLPLQTYTVAIHFVEQYFTAAQQRIFDVTVFANGLTNKALISFDIYHAAGGKLIAFTYEDTYTLGSDASLSIVFAASKDQATVAGIEIKLPAVLRIDAGSSSTFSDELAPSPHVWQADNYFTGSGSYFQPGNIANAADGSDGLYRSYHIANEFTYMLGSTNNLDPSTAYVAVLHFAELPGNGVTMEAGDRLMDVSAQGQDIFTDFDILSEAGAAYTAVRKHFAFTTDTTGVVTITFQSVGANPFFQDATLAGLEVYPALPSASGPTAAPTLAPTPASGPNAAPEVDITAASPLPSPPEIDTSVASPLPSPAAGPAFSQAAGPSNSAAGGPNSPSPSLAGPTGSRPASPLPSLAASPSSTPIAGPTSTPAAGPSSSPAAGPTSDMSASPSPSTSSNAASPVASPAIDPRPDDDSAMPHAASPANSKPTDPSTDIFKLFLQRYMASLVSSPAMAPDDSSMHPAESPIGELAPDPYSTPSAGIALAPKDESYMSPATSPESDMPTISQVTSLAMPPLQYGPAPGPPGSVHEMCLDLYNKYMPFITAQSDILLTQGILQPWQLSESYLADITAQNPLPTVQNPVTPLLGGNSIEDYPACEDLSNLMQNYHDIMILLSWASAPAPAPMYQAPTQAPLATEAPAMAPMPMTAEYYAAAPVPQPMPMGPAINYHGEDMPADDACKLMMADVNQALMSATMYMCQQSVDTCMHVYTVLNEAEAYTPPEQDLQDMGITDPLQCPNCVGYLKQNHLFDALYELADQIMMAPAPGPMPDQTAPETAPAMAPAPAVSPQPEPAGAASPTSGPGGNSCASRPVPTFAAPRYSAQTIVDLQLTFPAGYSLPSCAPDCLISLSCGQAGLHPIMEGYSHSQSSSPDVSANGTYPLTLYFPYNANYPPLGSQPPIITSCISYLPEPCNNTALSHLGDITFDATKPTLTITKVSEQRGDPSTARRKLQQTSSQPLFALMLFNFSKPIGNLTTDEILIAGGAVTEIIPVPDTYDYFVWVEVTSGTAALHITLVSGSITDAAGNILYTDPTNPQVFTIISENNQYSGIITYPSPPPPPSTVSAMATAAANMLSKGAIAGIVIGVFFGVLIVALIMAITFSVIRRRRILQRENDIVAGPKASPPKTVTFTGPPGPGASKGV